MRKAFTVLLALSLCVCLILLISCNGQKDSYHQLLKNAQRKNDVLQSLYDDAKEEWEETASALRQERDALKAEKLILDKALAAAEQEITAHEDAARQSADALTQARDEWEAQRQTLETELDAASGRISDVLALLLTPMPGQQEPEPEAEATEEPETGSDALEQPSLFTVSTPAAPKAPLPTPDLNWDVVSLMD